MTKYIFSAVLMLLLSGCVTTSKSAWEYYDECSLEHTSFADMVECGKQLRNASCKAANECSAAGQSVVQYADSLVASVRLNELSEEQARRLWIEFKTKEANDLRQAKTLSNMSMPSPTICSNLGNTVFCN